MQIDTHINDIINNDIIDVVIRNAITAWARESLTHSVTKIGSWAAKPCYVLRRTHLLLFGLEKVAFYKKIEFREIIARAANHHVSITVLG